LGTLFFQTFLCKEKFEQKKRRGKEKCGKKKLEEKFGLTTTLDF
jgi:hypothetical protein